MQVAGGKYIVLKGSDVCPSEGPGLFDSVRIKRENVVIDDNKLLEDVVLDSPSGAAAFIIGGAVNGWKYWKDVNGNIIDSYRNNE